AAAAASRVRGTRLGLRSRGERPARQRPRASTAGLERYAGHYERTSREFDVSVRDGRLAMELIMTGNLAALVGAEPEALLLYPAACTDPPGTRFVLRLRDDEPWAPVSFGQLADGTPYLYMSGRVAPRVS